MKPILIAKVGILSTVVSLLVACQGNTDFMTPQSLQNYSSMMQRQNISGLRAPADLVEAPGFQTGDKLVVDGPLWYDGDGKVHLMAANAFKVELTVGSYHYMLEATRIDNKSVDFVFTDLKTGAVKKQIAAYSRTANLSSFYLGKDGDIEEFSVNGIRPGYFESVIKQNKIADQPNQPDQVVKLKITKGTRFNF